MCVCVCICSAHQIKDKITENVDGLVREISMMSWSKALKQ